MPIPDFTTFTDAEILEAIGQLNELSAQRAVDRAEDRAVRRTQIGEAIASLEALLGREDTAPYDPGTGANATINGVLQHDTEDHAVLAANAGLALSLILHGMKTNVATVLNLAHVIATE